MELLREIAILSSKMLMTSQSSFVASRSCKEFQSALIFD